MTHGNLRTAAAAWRFALESRLRCPGFISLRQKTKLFVAYVSLAFALGQTLLIAADPGLTGKSLEDSGKNRKLLPSEVEMIRGFAVNASGLSRQKQEAITAVKMEQIETVKLSTEDREVIAQQFGLDRIYHSLDRPLVGPHGTGRLSSIAFGKSGQTRFGVVNFIFGSQGMGICFIETSPLKWEIFGHDDYHIDRSRNPPKPSEPDGKK